MPYHVPTRNTTRRGLAILAAVALYAGWRLVEIVVDAYKGAAG